MDNNEEVICTIEMIGGFELFNSRPYHNYETWSAGYVVKSGKNYPHLEVNSEDLDDAVRIFCAKMKELILKERKND